MFVHILKLKYIFIKKDAATEQAECLLSSNECDQKRKYYMSIVRIAIVLLAASCAKERKVNAAPRNNVYADCAKKRR